MQDKQPASQYLDHNTTFALHTHLHHLATISTQERGHSVGLIHLLNHSYIYLKRPAAPTPEEERLHQERRARERAERKLQTMTKEVDWRVAKAYVALADDPGEADSYHRKQKEYGSSAIKNANSSDGQQGSSRLEQLAVDRYFDDEEWEAEERRRGRGVEGVRVPLPSMIGDSTTREGIGEVGSGTNGKKGWW